MPDVESQRICRREGERKLCDKFGSDNGFMRKLRHHKLTDLDGHRSGVSRQN